MEESKIKFLIIKYRKLATENNPSAPAVNKSEKDVKGPQVKATSA